MKMLIVMRRMPSDKLSPKEGKMNKTLETEVLNKYALSEKIKKGELLRLMKVLHTRSGSAAAGPGKRSPGPRYSKATLDLLRQYFVERMAASREYAGVKRF